MTSAEIKPRGVAKGAKRGKYNAWTGGMTHKEIAPLLGLSPQRVQQIEAEAFRKIRAKFRELGLFLHDDTGPMDQDIYNHY